MTYWKNLNSDKFTLSLFYLSLSLTTASFQAFCREIQSGVVKDKILILWLAWDKELNSSVHDRIRTILKPLRYRFGNEELSWCPHEFLKVTRYSNALGKHFWRLFRGKYSKLTPVDFINFKKISYCVAFFLFYVNTVSIEHGHAESKCLSS